MKCPRLVAWKYKYLIKVQKYREGSYLVVYLDKTWFVSYDTLRMRWSDSTKNCSLSGPRPRGKPVAICQEGKSKRCLENSLLL